MLSDKEIKNFLGAGKQHLDGEYFTKKIISQLDYYPQPQAKKEQPEWTRWIVLISLFLGVALFVISGGASFILQHSIDLFKHSLNIINIFSAMLLLSIVAGGIIIVSNTKTAD